MRVVVDTNLLIDYLLGIDLAKTELERYTDVVISHMTWMEVMAGANAVDETAIRRFLDRFTVQSITDSIAEEAVMLRRQYRIRLPDAIIWATARTSGHLFVTRNTKDFPSHDPGVRVPYTL